MARGHLVIPKRIGFAVSARFPGAPPANVNVVGGGANGNVAFAPMHPIQAEIWRDLKKPRFSGLPQDVAQFIRDWNEVETIVRSASAHPVTDYAMLIELRKALDEP